MNAAPPAMARGPLHHWQLTQGAHFAERDGWLVADFYTSTDQEVAAVRSGLTLADLSAFPKFSLFGNDVENYCRAALFDEDVPVIQRAKRFDAEGPVLACRLAQDHILLLAESSKSTGLQEKLKHRRASEIVQVDVTGAHAGFCLRGPALEPVLRPWTALDVSDAALPLASCAETNLAGVHAVLVRTPEPDCLYLYVAWDLGEHVWMRLLDSGTPAGIQPIGVTAWETLRPARPVV